MCRIMMLLFLAGMITVNGALAEQADQKSEYLADLKKQMQQEKTQPGETIQGEVSTSPVEQNKTVETKTGGDEPVIRVLLMDSGYNSYFHPELVLVCNGKETVYTPETVKAEGGSVTVPECGEGIRITSIRRQNGNPVYEGSLHIMAKEEGIVAVNELPLESYLRAVVPSEMPSGYEKEALKAQAVCARTYAWIHMQEHGLEEYGADVDDSVNYQVYQNIPPQESTTEAVQETNGQILCQNGEPVETYYFSTSAGVTSTDEIWGADTAASYLKSVPCEFDSEEPWSRWQVEIPWQNLEDRVEKETGQPESLIGISITEKQESGAVTGLSAITETGTLDLEDEYSIREFLSPAGCVITEKDGTGTEGGTLLPSSYFELTVVPQKSVIVTGGGYGHGVGMSQNGANEMAKQDYDYEEILDYFYKDVELEQIS